MPLLVKAMASTVTFRVLPNFGLYSESKPRFHVKVRTLAGGDSKVVSSDSVVVNGASVIDEKEKIESLISGGIGRVGALVEEKIKGKYVAPKELEVLYDDGFGATSVKDYLDIAKEMIKPDGGPPRWFCPVDCGRPLKDSPTLLFLPGNQCLIMVVIVQQIDYSYEQQSLIEENYDEQQLDFYFVKFCF